METKRNQDNITPPMTQASPTRTVVRWLVLLAAFFLTAGFRYLTLDDGFPNDHFVYISGGWQMLFGEWPTRDWVDPGLPLMFLASAGAQAIFGTSLFAEAVLVSVAFGLGALLTVAAVVELTGSLWIAVVATLLEVAVFPRTYGYPKILVYAAAFWCFARYVNRPSTSRLVVMAVSVVVAFLFRHDHGIFLGIGGALTIALAPGGSSWPVRLRHLGIFVLAGLLLVLPYVAYVSVYGGLLEYVRVGLNFSRREAERQWHIWPAVFGDARPWSSALVYEFYVLPLLVLLTLAMLRKRESFRWHAAQVVPVIVVAAMVNYSFIRDPLETRLPDAIVPALVLTAWLIDRATHASDRRLLTVPVMVLGLAGFATSVASAGSIVENINRAGLFDDWDHLPRLFAGRAATLHERFVERQIPTRITVSLVPFLRYVDRCTTDDQRLIVGGYLVELPFFAQRRFAGGQPYFGGSFGDDGQRLALRRLRDQTAPFAIIPSDYASDFEGKFALIGDYLRSRYAELDTIQVTDDTSVQILVDTTLVPRGVDPETGWPCFK